MSDSVIIERRAISPRWISRLLDDSSNAEYTGLTRIENRCEGVDAPQPEIGHGECAAGDVLEPERSGPRFFAQRLGLGGDLAQALSVGAENYRDDQALVQRHRHPDVDALAQPDFPLRHPGVHPRMPREGARDSVNYQVGVSEIGLAAVPGAELDGVGHVGLVDDRELGGVLEALMHPLGDRLAHPTQRDGRAARRGLRRRVRCRGRSGRGALDVLARDAAARAGAGNRAKLDAEFGGELARHRADGPALCAGGACATAGRPAHAGGIGGAAPGAGDPAARYRAAIAPASSPGSAITATRPPALHRLSVFAQSQRQRPGRRGFDFIEDLFGFDFVQAPGRRAPIRRRP